MNPIWIFLIVLGAIVIDWVIGWVVINGIFKNVDVTTPMGIWNTTNLPWSCCILLFIFLFILFLPVYLLLYFMVFIDWIF